MNTLWWWCVKIIFSAFFVLSNGQRMSFGQCPNVEPMKNFQVDNFTGTWTEVERSFYFLESTVSCTKVNYTLEANTLTVNIFYKTPWRAAPYSLTYEADVSEHPGIIDMHLKTIFPPLMSRLYPGSGQYVILDTDYTDYALIYSCSNFAILHADFIWVLGRKDDIPVEMRAKVYSILDRHNINRDRLLLTPQKNC